MDAGNGTRDLPGDKGRASSGRLVVEEDAVDEEHVVGLSVVHQDPVRVLTEGGKGSLR